MLSCLFVFFITTKITESCYGLEFLYCDHSHFLWLFFSWPVHILCVVVSWLVREQALVVAYTSKTVSKRASWWEFLVPGISPAWLIYRDFAHRVCSQVLSWLKARFKHKLGRGKKVDSFLAHLSLLSLSPPLLWPSLTGNSQQHEGVWTSQQKKAGVVAVL